MQGTGMKGKPVPELIAKFWGDINKWPKVADGNRNFTQDQIRRTAEHISETGDCLWHAQSIVNGWPNCPCMGCSR